MRLHAPFWAVLVFCAFDQTKLKHAAAHKKTNPNRQKQSKKQEAAKKPAVHVPSANPQVVANTNQQLCSLKEPNKQKNLKQQQQK